MSESNYEKLFGTPERVAQLFADICHRCAKDECNDCPLDLITDYRIGCNDSLEWLLGDAE